MCRFWGAGVSSNYTNIFRAQLNSKTCIFLTTHRARNKTKSTQHWASNCSIHSACVFQQHRHPLHPASHELGHSSHLCPLLVNFSPLLSTPVQFVRQSRSVRSPFNLHPQTLLLCPQSNESLFPSSKESAVLYVSANMERYLYQCS